MNFTSMRQLLLLPIIILSCTFPALAKDLQIEPPMHTGQVINIKKTITVARNEVFDGKGNLYRWVGEGDCSQQEGMPPMFILRGGATLKNLWMENAPDGIHVKGSDISIDNIVNIDVCEDAITIIKTKQDEGGRNISIANSKFYKCDDKGLQLTRGNGITIKNNEFYDCSQAIRIKQAAKNIHIDRNIFWRSLNAVKITGGSAIVSYNYIYDSKTGFSVSKNGVLIETGENYFENTRYHKRVFENGVISKE